MDYHILIYLRIPNPYFSKLNFFYLVVIHLEAGVDPLPCEPDHMVLAVIHPDAGVLHNDVLLPKVIHHHHIAVNLK